MKPRTPRQRLQLVSGCLLLAGAPITFFNGASWGMSDWARYTIAGVQFLGGLEFLWKGLSSKERP